MLLEGSVFKLGNKGLIKTFKKRYFILPENQDIIYYYESRIERKQCGLIKLNDILHVGSSEQQGGQYHFDITVPGRIYKLYTLNEKERHYWIDGINIRLEEIKKRNDETKIKTNEMLKDLKIYTSYDGQQYDSDNDDTSMGSVSFNNTNQSTSRKLEREIELKEDEILKLQEEKNAFSAYVKELEDEKITLQKENERLAERLEESSIEAYQSTIKELETKRDELENDLKVMSKHLDEERILRNQAIKDRDLLEKTMSMENNELLLKAEELEVQKKKAFELISSGTIGNSNGSNNGESKKDAYNWPQLLFQIDKDNLQYRKQRDSYYLDNIKLKKKIDENLLIDRESLSLKSFEELANRLIKYDRVYRSQELNELYPIIFDEINCILNYLSTSSSSSSSFSSSTTTNDILHSNNDTTLLNFIDSYTPKLPTIITVNNTNNQSSSISDINNDMVKNELMEPMRLIQTFMEQCKETDQTIITLDKIEPYSTKIQSIIKVLERVKLALQEYRLKLTDIKADTSSFAIHPESTDPFEHRVESVLNKLEPYICQIIGGSDQETSILEDSKDLNNRISQLGLEFKAKIQYYEKERKKTEAYLSSLERMSIQLELELEQTTYTADTEQLEKSLEGMYNEKMDLIERVKRGVLDLTTLKRKAQLIRKLEEIQESEASLKYKANEDDILDVMVGSVIDSIVTKNNGDKDRKSSSSSSSSTGKMMNISGNGVASTFEKDGHQHIVIEGVVPPNFARLGEGLYLFGTKKINVQILSGGIVVRVGGGFESFIDYVIKFGRSETIKLLRQQQQITSAKSTTTMVNTSTSIVGSGGGQSMIRPMSRASSSRENRKSLVLNSNSVQQQIQQQQQPQMEATITSTITVVSASPKPSTPNRTPIANRMSRSLSKGVISLNFNPSSPDSTSSQ